jgi:Ca2+-binding EF-hand superfamily protein
MARGADFLSSDRDGDGSISFSELRLASGRISASTFRFEEVEEVFRMVDVDKDGVLGVTEDLTAISWLDTAGGLRGC